MPVTDRTKIFAAARENGWSVIDDPPWTRFDKGRRVVRVRWNGDGTIPADAYHGGKRLRANNLTGNIIGTLRKG